MALADYQALIDDLVRDDTGKITTADRDEAIARAVARYGKDRPRIKVEDVVAPGGNYLSLPAGWQSSFSAIRYIEHPVGNRPATLLDQDSYALYDGPSASEIQLIDAINAGQSVRVNYTIRHTVDGSTDSTPADDREAVSCWAAALLLDQLAAWFTGSSDSSIQAYSFDRRSKGGEYAARAGKLRKRYHDELGIDERKNVAAGVIVDLDTADSQGNDRLLHPRRYR